MQRYEELIEELEQNFPVDTLKYKGYLVWPLFRILLLYHGYQNNDSLNQKTLNAVSKKSLKARWGDLFSSIKNLKREFFLYKELKEKISELLLKDADKEDVIREAEVVFLYSQLHRNQNLKGTYCNMFLDPLLDEIESKHQCLVLEDIEWPEKAQFPRYKSSAIVTANFKKSDVLLAYKKMKTNLGLFLFPFKKTQKVEGFVKLQLLLPIQLRNSIYNSDDFLIYQMEKIINYKKTLKHILKKVRPKVLVQTSFYHPLGIAANIACSELGIKSVEMQHGILEPLAYWNFNQKMVSKFTMLPSYFWLWEADSCKTIRRWIENRDKVILGGNIWMKKMLKENNAGSNDMLKFADKVATYSYVVLYSMQPAPFNTVPDFLMEVMKERKDILWLIRVHPRLSKQDIPIIKNRFIENGIVDYEIDLASNLPLPFIVRSINLHITKFSAVVFDSAAMNVPTIFIDAYASEVYSRDYAILWNSGIIRVAADKLALKESILFFKDEKVEFKVEGYFGDDNYLNSFEKILND